MVTLLFTDIEGSTRLWEDRHDVMDVALARHDALVRHAIEAAGGHVFKTVGDAFCAVFAKALDAVRAAVAAERALAAEQWLDGISIRVRMAMHSGTCVERGGDYFGPSVNRVARLMSVGHGGQILVSGVTRQLVADELDDGVSLLDLGEHRLKDLGQPERVFQVRAAGLPEEFGPLASLDNSALLHNLPLQVTSFVGRVTELAEVSELLLGVEVRMVTLTGAGGAGKTRLGLQVAAQSLDGTGDGVWLVELAPVADPNLVGHTVASVLGVHEQPGRPVIETLVDAIADRNLLIVLDNCEHLLDATAKLADAILRACPRVHLLSTSREPLGISGEHVYRVPSLAVPAGDDLEPGELAAYDAVQLFVERACAQRRGFALDETNARAVAQLCTRLDGIPLAIELAAARVRSLSVEEINVRLDQRFLLLTGGSRNALPRQQTLRALIDWSYDLLNGHEQLLLDRLAVFAGGWTLDAAEAVTGGGDIDAGWVLDHLGALVDKSLVQANEREGATRYSLLDTIGHYAAERLAERGDAELCAVRVAHRDFYLAVAETAAPELHGPNQVAWMERLEIEHANLGAALAFCLADPQSRELGPRLIGSLRWFWEARDFSGERVELLEALLDTPEVAEPNLARAGALIGASLLLRRRGLGASAAARAGEAIAIARLYREGSVEVEALTHLAWLSIHQRDLPTALGRAEEAVDLARDLRDTHLAARSLACCAVVRAELGDLDGAREDNEEALSIARAVGDHRLVARTLSYLGLSELSVGAFGVARAYLEEALTIARQEDPSLLSYVFVLDGLGWVEVLDGAHLRAHRLFVDCLTKAVRAGFQPYVASSLLGLALVAGAAGDEPLACTLHGTADQLSERAAWTFESFLARERDRDRTRLRQAMGDAAFTGAYQRGRASPPADAIALATRMLETSVGMQLGTTDRWQQR